MTDTKNSKPRGVLAWSLTLVAGVLAVLMATLAYFMISVIRDPHGRFGAPLVLYFPLHCLLITLVATVLAFVASRYSARLAAWAFGLVAVLTAIMALGSWPAGP